MKKLFALLILFLCSISFAQENSLGGLDFDFKNRKGDIRTSLNLTAEDKLSIEDHFKLSFDISFSNRYQYGYILNITSNNNTLLLIYIPKNDSASFQLVYNDKPSLEVLTIHKDVFAGKNWAKINLNFDAANKKCTLTFNNQKSIKMPIGNMPIDGADITFGSYIDKFGWRNNDITSMGIKNIRIFDNNNLLKHFWKLDECSGDIAKDSFGSLDAKVLRPNWMMLNHFKFKTLAKIGPFPGFSKIILPDAAYDNKKNELILVSNNFLYRYNLNRHIVFKENFKTPLKQIRYVAIYDTLKDKLYALYSGGGIVSVYNPNEKSWSDIDSSLFHNGNYYGSSLFINPFNGDLCMIGGYGYYSVKNDLQKYDFQKKKWVKIKLKGEGFLPRTAALFGESDSKGSFYILGGLGNESGKQIEKHRQLSDLFILNMADTSVKKITDIGEREETGTFRAVQSLFYDPLKKQIFFLMGRRLTDNESSMKILRYDMKTRYKTVVSDSMISTTDLYTQIFFDKTNNKLIAFQGKIEGKDSLYIYIKTLRYPFLTNKEYKNIIKSSITESDVSKTKVILILFVLSLTSVGLYFFIRKRKIQNANSLAPSRKISGEKKQNSIFLFGDFTVFDKDSIDITKEFSPKIKQLFILLLMNSYNGSNHGITSEALTTYLWPDASSESGKNNRNVSIKKLRNIISKIEGIQIIKHSGWSIQINENVYCDFIDYHSTIENYEEVILSLPIIKEILSRGELLSGESYEWFDGKKAQIIEDCIAKLTKLSTSEKISTEDKIQIADSIMLLDSVNETALEIKISSFIAIGNHSLAKSSYELFRKEYFRLYAEDYEKPYSDFIK